MPILHSKFYYSLFLTHSIIFKWSVNFLFQTPPLKIQWLTQEFNSLGFTPLLYIKSNTIKAQDEVKDDKKRFYLEIHSF